MSETRALASYVVNNQLENIPTDVRHETDRQLDTKFRDQAVLAISPPQAEALLDLCWRIDEVDDVNEVVTAAVPTEKTSG